MSETAQEAQPKRRRRAKSSSLHVMKELTGLMEQRTGILSQIRAKRMELAELEASLQQLGTEIQWRAGVFGMVQKPSIEQIPAQLAADVYNHGHSASQVPVLDTPIFRNPEPPRRSDGINRGMADLSSLS